jgi:hypothetical protein
MRLSAGHRADAESRGSAMAIGRSKLTAQAVRESGNVPTLAGQSCWFRSLPHEAHEIPTTMAR